MTPVKRKKNKSDSTFFMVLYNVIKCREKHGSYFSLSKDNLGKKQGTKK